MQGCKKQDAFHQQQETYVQNAQFFSRYETDADRTLKPDFIDTIINLMKVQDLKAKFTPQVLASYGLPKWNQSIALANENGFKTLVIPVADSNAKVSLLIFAYQTSPDNVRLKFIDRTTVQDKLPLNGTPDKKLFTKNTLTGLFNSLQEKVESSSKQKEIVLNDYAYTRCWSYSYIYPDLSLTVVAWQCVTNVVVTSSPYFELTSAPTITNENNGGGGGGGGGSSSYEKSEEQVMEETYQKQVDEYAEGAEEGGTFNTNASVVDGIDPVKGAISWVVAKHRWGAWSVTATTKYEYYHTEYFDINLMRLVQNYNATYYKTEAINFVGSNYLTTSTWTTTALSDQVLNNNSENATGKTLVSGLINHVMNVRIKFPLIDTDRAFSAVTPVNNVSMELKFN